MVENPYKVQITQGEDFFINDNYEQALKVFEEVLREDPENTAAINDAGLAWLKLGRVEKAVECFELVLSLQPDSETAFFNLLDTLAQKKGAKVLKETFLKYEPSIPKTEEKKQYHQVLFQSKDVSDQTARVKVVSFSDVEEDQARKKRWGDYWFKKELEAGLQELDSTTVVNNDPNVLIHLFGAPITGLGAFSPDVRKILWIHSHPDWVSPQLLEKYDKVYCVSPAFTKKLKGWGFDAEVLIGATSHRFNQVHTREDKEFDIVFVGNAKEGGRKIIYDIMRTPYKVAIWGEGWEDVVPDSWIEGTYFPNARLGELYAKSKIVLNDHHEDMRLEGFISPRVLDALAVGTAVISDDLQHCPKELAGLFERYKSVEELESLIKQHLDGGETKEQRDKRIRIASGYTFDQAAAKMISDLRQEKEEDRTQRSQPKALRTNGSDSRSKKNQGYIVMGMHRSGTSLITQLLHRAGIYAGCTYDHIPPASDNPKGFWELSSLVDLNKIILFLANGNWKNPPTAKDIEAISATPRVQKILNYFSGAPKWVIKDPRLCLTFPVIAAALPESTKVIVVKRSPDAIAQSLQKRDELPLSKGLQLTETYLARVERYTRHYDRVEVQFEELFCNNRKDTLRKLESFIGQELTGVLDPVLEPKLKHF